MTTDRKELLGAALQKRLSEWHNLEGEERKHCKMMIDYLQLQLKAVYNTEKQPRGNSSWVSLNFPHGQWRSA